jgi:hypothetical protein
LEGLTKRIIEVKEKETNRQNNILKDLAILRDGLLEAGVSEVLIEDQYFDTQTLFLLLAESVKDTCSDYLLWVLPNVLKEHGIKNLEDKSKYIPLLKAKLRLLQNVKVRISDDEV